MTPETRALVVTLLGERHDALLERLYQGRFTTYARWRGFVNPERIALAREIRAVRCAIRELKPSAWPAAYAQPDQALAAWHRESR